MSEFKKELKRPFNDWDGSSLYDKGKVNISEVIVPVGLIDYAGKVYSGLVMQLLQTSFPGDQNLTVGSNASEVWMIDSFTVTNGSGGNLDLTPTINGLACGTTETVADGKSQQFVLGPGLSVTGDTVLGVDNGTGTETVQIQGRRVK